MHGDWYSTDFYWLCTDFVLNSTDFLLTSNDFLLTSCWLILTFYWILLNFYWLLRSTAFQPCLSCERGWGSFGHNGSKHVFPQQQKNCPKTIFWGTQIWIFWLRRGIVLKILNVSKMCFWKLWDTDFQMSYREICWRQYCPIDRHLKKFLEGQQKMQKNVFFAFCKLLKILVLAHISRVSPCESSRKCEQVFGCGSFWTGVIAAQIKKTAKF